MMPSSQLQSAGFALSGFTLWVLADTSLKIAGASALPAYEVTAIVGLSIAVILGSYGIGSRDLGALWPKNVPRQLLRSMLDLANGIGVVIALRHMPLALFYILIFCSPMVTALLSAVFLHEQVGSRTGIAILLGFVGVVVAVNPFASRASSDWVGYLACGTCVASFSANMVWSRVMTQTETSRSLTFFSGAVMATIGFTMMLWKAAPVSGQLAVVMSLAGLFCVIGSLCFFLALKHTSAAIVSQFHYSQLITGALIAYLIWRERPSTSMLLGAGLIIAGGCYAAAECYRAGEDTMTLEGI